jgi:hypothetical protein
MRLLQGVVQPNRVSVGRSCPAPIEATISLGTYNTGVGLRPSTRRRKKVHQNGDDPHGSMLPAESGKLVPDQPKSARSHEAAIELAERLGGLKAGAAAFSQEIDVGTDTCNDPRVLCRTGTLPRGLLEDQ